MRGLLLAPASKRERGEGTIAIKYGKSEVSKMVKAIDQDYDSFEDAAKAALATAEEIFEDRAKFVVVGQLAGTKGRLEIPPSDPEAIKLSLGWFSTEGDARKAAESLWHSTATGDIFRVWVLNVFHGTPAELHNQRKAKYAELEAKQDAARTERLMADIEKRRQESAARAAGGAGACKCGHLQGEHGFDGTSRGACGYVSCGCEKWDERKTA